MTMAQAEMKLLAPGPEAQRLRAFFCDRALALADEAAQEPNAARRKELEQGALRSWQLARRRLDPALVEALDEALDAMLEGRT
jgi:hypothetical protein